MTTDPSAADPATATVAQFKALHDEITDEDSKANAAILLRDRLRHSGYAMSTDPVAGKAVPVTLNADHTGWRPFESGMGRLDGHVIEWTASGVPIVSDPEPLTGGTVVDGAYSVPVPADVTAAGGPVRVHHGFSGPVTVKAYTADDKPMGYLFTQPVTPDEEHVELVPGTALIQVHPDPESSD